MSLSVAESREIERAYVEHRPAVIGMLRSQFGGVRDLEELYQEAWAEALELQARGETIGNLGGLLRTIAWRRARDRLRNKSADAVDPTGAVLGGIADPGASPEEQAQVRLDAAALRQVVESLDERQAAAIKLRFDEQLSGREIQVRLGVSAKRLEKLVTAAYQQVAEQLGDPTEPTASPWRLRQRSLLMACELGVASARQRRVARRMVAEDAVCRAMLREIRSTLEQIAAVLPLPVIAHPKLGVLGQVRGNIADRLAAVRDGTADLAGRLGGNPSTVEQAAAGGTAGLGAGAAVKVALVCMAAAGGTVVCIQTNPFDKPHRPTPREQMRDKNAVASSSPRGTQTTTTTARQTNQQTTTNANAAAAPSPAPKGGTEFGPGATGSTAASSTPASAPAGGGGEFTP